MGEANRIARFLDRTPGYTVPAILLGVPVLMTLLSAVSDAFYRNVVWRYYWGPIKADAYPRGSLLCSNGEAPVGLSCAPGHVIAEAGYNWLNTASWAVLLALCLLGIAQILHRLDTKMDDKLIVGAVGWVLAGSIFHVLQDANLFLQPLEFIFITPPIYLLFGAFGVLSLVYAHYAKVVSERLDSLEAGLQKIWFMFMAVVLGYTLLWLTGYDQIVRYLNPFWVTVFAIITFAVVRMRANKLGRIDPSEMTLVFSLGWFLASLAYVQNYLAAPWPGEIPSDDLRYAFWVAPLAAAAVAGAVYLVARWRKQKGSKTAFAYMMPMNLLLVFSQMVDAFGTAIGIDLSRYSEKHVLSEAVRHGAETLWGTLGWAWGEAHPTFTGFAAVKLAVSLLVVYAIDVQSKEDVEKYPTMIGLVKFAIIMVGIGPGVRNIVRMSLGI